MASDKKDYQPKKDMEEPATPQGRQSIGKGNSGKNKTKRKFWLFIKGSLLNIVAPLSVMDSVGYFTAVLAIVAGLQWLTLEKTDQTLKAEQRPWVSLKSMDVASDLIWRPDGTHLDIQFALKNTGHSPAVRAFTHSKAFVMFGREPNPQTAQSKFCDDVRKQNVGDAIFPGDFVIQPQGLFFERADVDTALRTAPQFKFLDLMILICVNYRLVGESANHQTTYIFTIQRKPYTEKDGRQSIAIYPDDTVPGSEIAFRRFFVGFDAN